MNRDKIIGIVGGVGPYAGLDMVRKIFDQTEAKIDQDHLPIAMISFPKEIEDRTDFLTGETVINPGFAIAEIIKQLETLNAEVVGIACNSAHSPKIFDVILDELIKAKSRIKLINMTDEVVKFIRKNHSDADKIGLMSTIGTYYSEIYNSKLKSYGMTIIKPSKISMEILHKAIYDRNYGIKAYSNPIKETAVNVISGVIEELHKQGARVIILGCTELALLSSTLTLKDSILIDPSLILARALIRESNPKKLKPPKVNS